MTGNIRNSSLQTFRVMTLEPREVRGPAWVTQLDKIRVRMRKEALLMPQPDKFNKIISLIDKQWFTPPTGKSQTPIQLNQF